MGRRIIAVVAVILIICAFAVCLTACNAVNFEDRLTNKGFQLVDTFSNGSIEGYDLTWAMSFERESDGSYVTIYKCKDLKTAKEMYDAAISDTEPGYDVKRSGRFVAAGSEKAVEIAL